MVDTLPATPDQLSAATALFESVAGIDWAYDLLDDVCERHGLPDALLVVRPEPSTLQLFRRGRLPVPPHRMAALATCRSGVVDPRDLLLARTPVQSERTGAMSAAARPDPTTNAVLGALCDAHYRALSAARSATFDAATGLLSPHAIDGAIVRAAACGARYGWTSTVAALTTGGDTPADQRWLALAKALRAVVRTGDGAGVLATGSALVLLGNVGPDAVRPFVARVRAALCTAGFDSVELFAATATTPRETVDPAQLRQLALERLGQMGAPAPASRGERATAELDVRSVPGVVWVAWGGGTAPHVTVGTSGAAKELTALVTSRVHDHFPDASVSVVDASAAAHDANGTHGDVSPGRVRAPLLDAVLARASSPTRGDATDRQFEDHGASGSSNGIPPLLCATAPGAVVGRGDVGSASDCGAPCTTVRVMLVRASFDAALGRSQVTLALGPARSTGHAPAGPLVGGAQATIDALRALGEDVPFYLVSAERMVGIPGEPVVIVLGAHHTTTAGGAGSNERIGVAGGTDDADAASRATLGALNRYLSRPRSS